MLKTKCLVISVLFMVLALVSCDEITYSPEKKNFVDIEQQHDYNLVVNLDSVGNNSGIDTLFVYGEIELNYSIETEDKPISKILFYVDDLLDGETYDEHKYTINTENYTNGNHKFKFEVWVRSRSGSLADRHSREYIVSTKEFDMFIDNRELTNSLKIDSIYECDGRLKFVWQKYPYVNFYRYYVYAAFVGANGYTSDYYLKAEINDKNKNYYIDSSFLGGKYKYRIDIRSEKKLTQGEELLFEDESPYLYPLENINDEKIAIRWKKCKYYRNLEKSTILMTHENLYDRSLIVANVNNFADTTVTGIPLFGGPVTYYIRFEAKLSFVESNRRSIAIGNKFPEYKGIQYIHSLNSIYLHNNSECIRLDAKTFQEKARGKGNVFFSNNGSFAYSNNIGISNPPHSFTKVDPLTLEPIGNTFTTESFMKYYSVNESYALLDNGTCLFGGFRYTGQTQYGPPAIVLLSMDPVKILMRDSSKNNNLFVKSVSKLTDEGQYVSTSISLYNVKDNKFTNLGYVKNTWFGCFSESGKEYITTTLKTISILKCSDNTLIKSFPIEADLYYPVLDLYTGYIGGVAWPEYKYRIYNLQDGRIMKEIDLVANSANYLMVNSFLISEMGYCIKLNFEN